MKLVVQMSYLIRHQIKINIKSNQIKYHIFLSYFFNYNIRTRMWYALLFNFILIHLALMPFQRTFSIAMIESTF